MDRHELLWAPWRLAYLSGEAGAAEPAPKTRELKYLPGAEPECFICRAVADSADRENLLIERSKLSVVMLNRFPYNNGHLLIAPLQHLGRINELNEHAMFDQQRLIAAYVAELERLMNAQGFNIGLNVGKAGGAGLPGHLHWHVVPRWTGDTNFMPVAANVRIIPQALDALWETLHEVRSGAGGRPA